MHTAYIIIGTVIGVVAAVGLLLFVETMGLIFHLVGLIAIGCFAFFTYLIWCMAASNTEIVIATIASMVTVGLTGGFIHTMFYDE